MFSKVLSIEIGYSLTKVCEVDYKVKNPKIYQSFVLETPEGMFEDELVKDDTIFAETFKRKLIEKGIRTKQCVFSIASSKIASREVPIPSSVKRNRIQTMVEANARDYFPVELSDYKLSYAILDAQAYANIAETKTIRLLAMAAPKKLLESYVRFGYSCGLETVGLDYNGNSLYQAVKSECKAEETRLFVKIDESAAYCMVVKNGSVAFTRNVNYGIDDAIDVIQKSKVFGENLSYTDAMELVRSTNCIYRTINPTENSKEDADKDATEKLEDTQEVRAAKIKTTEAFAFLVGGINRVLDFYNSKNIGNPITGITITGMGADFTGLSKLLTNEANLKTSVLTTIEVLKMDKTSKETSLSEYISCIGASIDPVNFIGIDENKKTKEKVIGKDYTFASILFFALGCVIGATMLMAAILPYSEAKAKQSQYNSTITKYEPAYDVFTEYLAVKSKYDKLVYFDNYTETMNNHIVEFIEEMEATMPSGAVVHSFASTNEGLELALSTDSRAAAAKLIAQFRTFKSVADIQVNALTFERVEGNVICTFNASIRYKNAQPQ